MRVDYVNSVFIYQSLITSIQIMIFLNMIITTTIIFLFL